MAKGLTINFRFMGNNQNGKAQNVPTNAARSRGKFASLDNFARIIVEDVAIAASKKMKDAAQTVLVRDVTAAVNREVSQLARMIFKYVIQPDGSTGPKGQITSADSTGSQMIRQQYGGSPIRYELSNSNVKWAPRSNAYLLQKSRSGFSEDWWHRTGQLTKQMSMADFGPVSVRFTPTSSGNDRLEDGIKTTSSGLRGAISKRYDVGKLEVAVFGRITPEMLPSLASGDIGNVTPRGSRYLPELFRNKNLRDKLMTFSTGEGGKNREYRPVVEPFVSYFLTRAIPNAVFNRTEKLVAQESYRSLKLR